MGTRRNGSSTSRFSAGGLGAEIATETGPSHLGLDLLKQRLQLVHVGGLLWPTNSEPLLLIRFGDLPRKRMSEQGYRSE